ncbi:hexose phosphate transporter [Mycoplasma yeatsii]|uniref:MFS family permease n=1 Tax=Mycoplasma yeatsii TaxID=51365 RepID=A0ABU0NE53_9MOLU|nr:hexose phosphate transporter [Mycoplasma yeatsii]MDQ0567710.1 MFS family permease [Mycoplasma yeatsii]
MNNKIKEWSQKNKVLYGFILWSFISFAYMLFIANWGFSLTLAGDGVKNNVVNAGFLGYFGIQKDANFQLISQIANWSITLGRGIGSVLVALLLAKFAHKYTTIIAIAMTLVGIPAAFMPATGYGYALFLVLRTIMAIGGTTLIILTQPVVANFFGPKQKSVVSQFGIWFYPLGTIISIVPVLVVTNSDAVREQWKLIVTLLAALNIIPLLLFIFIGTQFDVKENEPRVKVNGWSILGSYVKKKQTYAWVLLYGGWLCIAVFLTTLTVPIFNGLSKAEGIFDKYIFGWQVAFLSAVFVGPISLGLWSRKQAKRRWFIATAIASAIVLFTLSTLTFVFGVAKHADNKSMFGFSAAMFIILGFLTGLCIWGIQGVMLNLPHEYKESDPKTIGWMFSLIWGFGYVFFTLVLILISGISLIPALQKNQLTLTAIQFVLIILSTAIAFIGILMLKEPHPEYPMFPCKKVEQAKVEAKVEPVKVEEVKVEEPVIKEVKPKTAAKSTKPKSTTAKTTKPKTASKSK